MVADELATSGIEKVKSRSEHGDDVTENGGNRLNLIEISGDISYKN